MSEMNNEFEQLLEETSLVTIHNGEVVKGQSSALRKMRSFLTSATKQMVSLLEMSIVINPAST